MISEKMDAMEEAKAIIARGGNPSLVIENYKRIVAANFVRLSASAELDALHAMFWDLSSHL